MNTGYIIRFTLIMTTVVALALAGLYSMLKEKHDLNEELFEKRAILEAISPYLDQKVSQMTDQDVVDIFENKMEQKVVNTNGEVLEDVAVESIDMAKEKKKPEAERRLPLYIYDSPQGKVFILSVRGSGLWDEIWGSIALKEDLNTIAGVAFDHKAETPGLGAEIKDNPAFPAQFRGKQLYNEQGEFVSVDVVKGGAEKGNPHEVDGISGATITAVGVAEMLDKGIKLYEPYLKNIKTGTGDMGQLVD